MNACFYSEYEQTMDALQQELIGAEKEKTELKDKLKSFSKKALLAVGFILFYSNDMRFFRKIYDFNMTIHILNLSTGL